MGFKGVILAGGLGTRLHPLTLVTNKHLLPVYDKPMIYYPLLTLANAGIKEILIISSPGELGHFVNLLGSGKDFGVQLRYEIQKEPKGIAHALALAETFVNGENVCLVLGDNIIQDKLDISDFIGGCRIYLKQVTNPKSYGIAELEGDKVISVTEKPEFPKSNLAVIGLYVYDNNVFDIIRTIEPSARGELEITSVNNAYVKENKVDARMMHGFWKDAGSIKSLFEASEMVKNSLE
jgi:glucose-1-phosphate thymidylyltransferase